MTKSIYRSGRVVHVWHRHSPALTGHYIAMRGGREIGPYTGPGMIALSLAVRISSMAANLPITTTPRQTAGGGA